MFVSLCHFCQQWRAQEKVNEERSLALSRSEGREGTSSEGAQTSISSSEPQSISAVCEEIKETEKEKLEERVEAPTPKPVVIEIKDEPDVILLQ